MLRSLDPFKRDKKGDPVVEDGVVQLVKPGSEQPKAREAMEDHELHYVDVTAKERDDDLAIARFERKLKRDTLLAAAKQAAAKS